MKKIIFLISIFLVAIIANATDNKSRTATADVTIYSSSAKSFISIGGGGANDTLESNDTITHIVAISAADVIDVSGSFYYDKTSTGKPSITAYFYQSFDGTNYAPLKKGINRTAYTVATSGIVTQDTAVFYSFRKDTVYMDGKYLKVIFYSSTSSSTKDVITHRCYIKRK